MGTKAYKNTDFLDSSLARHIRIMCELQEPNHRLKQHGAENHILFVGSHLTMLPEERVEQISKLEQQMRASGPRAEMEAETSMLSRESLDDFTYLDTAEEAFEFLVKHVEPTKSEGDH